MPNPGIMTITIRKEVASYDEAEALWQALQTKLADRPDLKVTAHFSNPFKED